MVIFERLHIHVFEEADLAGGRLAGEGWAQTGSVIRGGWLMKRPHPCTCGLLSTLPHACLAEAKRGARLRTILALWDGDSTSKTSLLGADLLPGEGGESRFEEGSTWLKN